MKRLFLLLICALILCSCAPKGDILSYQEGDIVAECKINGKYDANIIKKEDFRALELTSGELTGISFTKSKDGWCASLGEVSIPIDEEHLDGIVAITSVFDLRESAITTAQSDGALGIVSFDMDNVCYTVTYNQHSVPERVTIEGDCFLIEIEINSIRAL